VWDRREGKSIQQVVTTGSEIRTTTIVTQEELEAEKKEMFKELENE